MKYTCEQFWEDFRRVMTTCVGGLLVAWIIWVIGPQGFLFKSDATKKTITAVNNSWSSVTDTYQVISRDLSRPNITVDNSQFATIVKPEGSNNVYVQLNLPKSKSLSLFSENPYDLIKVEGVPTRVLGADEGTVAPIFPNSDSLQAK